MTNVGIPIFSAAQCIHQKEPDDDAAERSAVLKENDIIAVFGAYDLNISNDPGRVELSPKRIIVHQNWTTTSQDYDSDIALLEFEKIDFNDHIKPIYIWTSTDVPSMAEGVVVGWTKTGDATSKHVPKKLTVPIQTNEECFLTTKSLIYFSSRKTFCAGFRNFSMTNTKGLGVCRGDRGSGLFIYVKGQPYLKGMMSANTEAAETNCDVSRNSVYANVFKFGDWIVNHTQIPPEEFAPPAPLGE